MSDEERYQEELYQRQEYEREEAQKAAMGQYAHDDYRLSLVAEIDDSRLRELAEAERDGRVVVFEKHKIKDGTVAWTIYNGEVIRGIVGHCVDGYGMYFRSDLLGFPFYNFNIGENVFLSVSDALKEIEREEHHE